MKIGLLFGSFDPFHIGHLSMITSALNSKQVEAVRVVVVYQNPWKEKCSARFTDRFDLTLEGCKGLFKHVTVTSIEGVLANILHRPPYTFEVLEHIKSSNPEDEFCIITSDETFSEIENWKEGKKILKENDFLIVHREGFAQNFYKPIECKSYTFIKSEFNLEVSSTKIRNMLFRKINPVPFISADQYYYIQWNYLYEKL